MVATSSYGAYSDCFELLERALTSTKGIRFAVQTKGEAYNWCMRLHYARTLERNKSMEIYKPEQPEYGTSVYDNLIIRRPYEEDDQWYLRIEPRSISKLDIEELGAAE